MNLAVGAKRIIFLIKHVIKNGWPKILSKCTLLLTNVVIVNRIITNLAIIDIHKNSTYLTHLMVKPSSLYLVKLAPNVSFDEVQNKTDGLLLVEKNSDAFV